MKKDDLLSHMRDLLIEHLDDRCLSHSIDFDRGRGSFQLINGSIIYVRFNNYDQYSYVIQFSSKKLDRVRFDNYDQDWKVSTNPHHLHLRNSERVTEAQTIGKPEHDITIVIGVLKAETKLFE